MRRSGRFRPSFGRKRPFRARPCDISARSCSHLRWHTSCIRSFPMGAEPRTLVHVPPAALREPDVDDIVRELRELYCVAGLRLMTSVGKVVMERVFGGSVERWHSRGRKDSSFRKLAWHPQLPFSRPTLARAVGIYVLSLRRPDLLELPHLGTSQARELVGLKSDIQDHLICQTVEHRWSVERLREEVHRLCLRRPRRRPEAQPPAFASLLRSWHGELDGCVLVRDLDRISHLDPTEAAELLDTAKQLSEQSETLVRHLARRAAAQTQPEEGAAGLAVPARRPSGIVPTVSTRRHSRSGSAR